MPRTQRKTKPKATFVDVHVGHNLKKFRIVKGMSQDALGKAEGITFQQIQKYEVGLNRISASRLYEFSKILGIDIKDFFSGLEGVKNNKSFEILNSLDKESMELLVLFQKISDPEIKRTLISILKSM